MKVWIAEKGCYEDRSVEGVYGSLEAAKAANPFPDNPELIDRTKPPAWRGSGDGLYSNGCDWDDHVVIYAMTVEGLT